MTTMPRNLERALIRAGVPEDEARAVADGFDQLATKGDLDALRLATKGDLDALRGDFDAFQERILELFEQHRIDTDRRLDDFRDEFIRALSQHQESTDKRFGDMNQRIDDTNRSIADLRDDMNKRFEELNRTMWRIFIWMGGVITGLLGVLVYQVFS